MKSLGKSFAILELFLVHEELGISDLAQLTGENVSTVHHIVSFLVKKGYLAQHEKRGKYKLGTKFLDFSGIIKSRLKIREVALPFMKKLSQQVDECVDLAIWNGKEAIHADTVQPRHALRILPDDFSSIHLHCTGVGKAILANISELELKEFFKNNSLNAHTPNTITDVSELKRHFATIRRKGFAFDDEEREAGIRNLAAPIKDWDGKTTAAIGILGPSVRLTRNRAMELVPIVKKYASDISRALGCNGE